MQRLWLILKKELICTKENIIFNLATIASPLFFLAVFTFMLSDGVSFPFNIVPADETTSFICSAAEFTAPNGINYMEFVKTDADISQEATHDALSVEEDLYYEDGVLHGKIVHYINDVNQNTLKNSRNRIDGALVNFINNTRTSGNIEIVEKTVYEEDIPWATGFGASILVFGIMLAGMFFGALSIICEYDNRTTTFLKLSPYPIGYVLFGKIAANLLKCIMSGSIYYTVYTLLFDHVARDTGTLILVCLLGYIAFIGIGMLIGIALKVSVTAMVASMGIAFALWILGGGFGPLTFFGKTANLLASFNPTTYMVNSVKWCLFGGTATVHLPLLVIAAFTVVTIIVSSMVYTRWTAAQEG